MSIKQRLAGLIAAALLGLCGLVFFADFVARRDAKQAGGSDRVVRGEVLTLVGLEALIDFSKGQDLSAIASRDELMCLIECEGLRKTWYGIRVRIFQANGQSQDASGIGDITEPNFRNTLDVLQTFAGRPPRTAAMDYSRARIVVIPRRLENAEPATALEQLLMQPGGADAASPGSDR